MNYPNHLRDMGQTPHPRGGVGELGEMGRWGDGKMGESTKDE